jgi:predicted nucleic acid-binding protein
MNRPGVLLDTGPLVALISKEDREHDRAKQLFAACEPPLRTCEPVIAEACFLIRHVDANGPAEIISLGRKGLYAIALSLEDHGHEVEALLKKYRNRPISLADACLIRCADVYDEPRILTFDSDFAIYRWARNKAFRPL